MKKITSFLIAVVIFFLAFKAPFPDSCTTVAIRRDVPLQIFEALARDGHQTPIIVTRFFHNKVTFYGSNVLRCYLSYLDPAFLLKTLTPAGAVFAFFGILNFFTVKKDKRPPYLILVLFAFSPLLGVFSLPSFSAKLALWGPVSSLIFLGSSHLLQSAGFKNYLLVAILALISVLYFVG